MGDFADDALNSLMGGDLDGDFGYFAGRQSRPPRCNRCGSTDVRWRQQGGKWVLFSSKPGIEHVCTIKDEFDALD